MGVNLPWMRIFFITEAYPKCILSTLRHTAMKFWLRTIADIWSKVGILWESVAEFMALPRPWKCNQTIARHQTFQMRYYKSLYLKGLPNCGLSKLAVKKKSWHFGFESTFFAILCSDCTGPGSIPGRGGFLRLAVPWDTRSCSTSLESSDVLP